MNLIGCEARNYRWKYHLALALSAHRAGRVGAGEPSPGEEGAERRDGCVAEERGLGEGDLGSGNNLSAGVLATLNVAVGDNLKSTFREKEQLSAKSDLPVHVYQIGL